jgi:hypothetical protein
MPMPPSVMRSLGATWPSRPSAELGTMENPAAAAKPAPAERLRKARREIPEEREVFMAIIPPGIMTRKRSPRRAASILYISWFLQPQVLPAHR